MKNLYGIPASLPEFLRFFAGGVIAVGSFSWPRHGHFPSYVLENLALVSVVAFVSGMAIYITHRALFYSVVDWFLSRPVSPTPEECAKWRQELKDCCAVLRDLTQLCAADKDCRREVREFGRYRNFLK